MKHMCLHLFSNCKVVKGVSRSALYDLQKGKVRLIPNVLAEILLNFQNSSVSSLYEAFPDDENTIRDYLNTLCDEGYVTFLHNSDIRYFPNMDISYDHPTDIQVLIAIHSFPWKLPLKPFIDLGLNTLVWISKNSISESIIVNWLEKLEHTTIDNLIFVFTQEVDFSPEVETLIENHPRIVSCRIYQAKKELQKANKIERYSTQFSFERGPKLMRPHMDVYSESQDYHTYFHKKLFVDEEEMISPTYTFDRDCMNLSDITDEEALQRYLQRDGVKKIWNISKDDTMICKDCEFRHLCIDSRIPVFNKERGQWEHQQPCSYIPHHMRWGK